MTATVTEQKKKQGRIPKIRQARIGVLLHECPICGAGFVDAEEAGSVASEKFSLVQHMANNDNTGFESYLCQYCKKQIVLVISASPILVQPQFAMGPLFGGQQAQDAADPSAGAQPST